MKNQPESNAGKILALLTGIFLITGFTSSAYAACTPYFAESDDGDGGFRLMHDEGIFHAIADGDRFDGEICDRDSVRVELAKRKPKTVVTFHIKGKALKFESGDEGDKNINDWYRKYLDIDL